MTLREAILEIIEKHEYWTDGAELAADEITLLIEKDYKENEFIEWFDEHYNESGEPGNKIYDYWKLNVKESKGTITDVDLKQINQASDDYYKRNKLFERKK